MTEGLELAPVLFGLLVGFLVGLTGVGGGSLMTPFLIAVLGVPAPTAVGTDMVFATATKMTGSVQHYRQRSVNLEVAIFLGLGSIPASLLGVWTLVWIKGAFDPEAVRNIMITIIAATLVLFGATGGYLVGLTSIGSGSVMAVILLLLYPLAPAIVVGTDIAHATVLSLVTGFAHLLNGNVDLPLAGTLLLGSIPGVLVGSRLAPRLPGRPLTIILAIMLVFVGARLLLS